MFNNISSKKIHILIAFPVNSSLKKILVLFCRVAAFLDMFYKYKNACFRSPLTCISFKGK